MVVLWIKTALYAVRTNAHKGSNSSIWYWKLHVFPTIPLYSGLYPQCTQLRRCFWSTDDCKTTLHFSNFSGLKIIISCSPDKNIFSTFCSPNPNLYPSDAFSAVDLTWSWVSAVKELTTNMKELLLWSCALVADFKNKLACPQQLANS